MKNILLSIVLLFTFYNTTAQSSKEERIITAIKLDSTEIFLNNKVAFNYSRVYDDFVISDLNGKELISGRISSIGDGKFSSILTFATVGKRFSNKDIIGRKEIIFALCNNNIITADFTLDEKKLLQFLRKYNELKQ